MNREATTLEQRISDALQPDTATTSAAIAALIDEAEAGIAKADREGTVNQTLSLDPKAARQAIEDATFAANRLRMLLSKLQVRYREVHDQEQAKAWLAEYDVMKRKRDALAEEVCEVYPDAEIKIVDLLVRITENNKALSALHQARPPGVMEHLVSAELHARGLDRFTRDTPSLLTSVCLFDWDRGRQIWPPPRPSISAAFAATLVPAYNPADWATNHEQRAARSSGSDSIWPTTMRARPESKKSAKIERRENVSLRASAETASESPQAYLPSKPSVSAHPLTQVAGLRKGTHRHNRETSRLSRRSATANFLRAVLLGRELINSPG
jgi:hypothetical protein